MIFWKTVAIKLTPHGNLFDDQVFARYEYRYLCGGFKDEVQHGLGIHETPDAVF